MTLLADTHRRRSPVPRTTALRPTSHGSQTAGAAVPRSWQVCLLFMGAVVKKNFATWACFLVSAAYCLFWLMIPIIGYTWFFAWKYVDTIARQQEDIEHGELRHMVRARTGICQPAVPSPSLALHHAELRPLESRSRSPARPPPTSGRPFRYVVPPLACAWLFSGIALALR